jgi:hypothetical protein
LASLLQLPPVDDVTVENQPFRRGVLQEMNDFTDLAVWRTEVNIGDDDGPVSQNLLIHSRVCYGIGETNSALDLHTSKREMVGIEQIFIW